MKLKLKRQAFALNYIFIIFVSVIAVFVIVGMLSKWALSSNRFMCKLSGDCEKEEILDKETITVENGEQSRFVNEIVKHAKICYERSSRSENEGELCYTVKCNGCTAGCSSDGLQVKIGTKDDGVSYKAECTEFENFDKAIIEFDYDNQQVIIK